MLTYLSVKKMVWILFVFLFISVRTSAYVWCLHVITAEEEERGQKKGQLNFYWGLYFSSCSMMNIRKCLSHSFHSNWKMGNILLHYETISILGLVYDKKMWCIIFITMWFIRRQYFLPKNLHWNVTGQQVMAHHQIL